MVNIAIALINGETRTFIEYLYHNSLNNIELILLISPTLEGEGEGGDEEGLKEMHFQRLWMRPSNSLSLQKRHI